MRRVYVPYEYQKQAVAFLLNNRRCALYAGMGLGKTVSTLTALDALYVLGDETKPALVLAPLRVAKTVWPEEVRKWAHLSEWEASVITGTAAERARALEHKTARLFCMNYENLPWLMKHLNGQWPFGPVVADEATLLKGFRLQGKGTARASSLARVAHEKCTRFIALSGTPSPNGLQDLWGQWWFIDQGKRLGRTYGGFKERWFVENAYSKKLEKREYAFNQIMAAIKDLSLAINPRDHFDLREPIIRSVVVDMPEAAYRQYKRLQREMFLALGEEQTITAVNAAALTMKCLQFANGAVYVDKEDTGEPVKTAEWRAVHDVKIDALRDIIEEAAGMPVLVAYHFKSDLARLLKAFPQGRKLTQDARMVEEWNAGKVPVMFVHPASAGHGLNLQYGGNILVFFGLNWNLEHYLQVIERIGPMRQLQAGLDRAVFVYNIVARGTVDELVLESRETKREVQEMLLDALSNFKQKTSPYAEA